VGELVSLAARLGARSRTAGRLAIVARGKLAEHVNAPQTEAELAAIRRRVQRGSPSGDWDWKQLFVPAAAPSRKKVPDTLSALPDTLSAPFCPP
jgi:hypothetical protein